MSNQAARLIDELYQNASNSGNQPLERRLADLAIWFYKNRGAVAADNLAGRQAFNEKAIWIMLEALALAVERIHELEGKGKSDHLWLPKGVAVNGDLRKFG